MSAEIINLECVRKKPKAEALDDLDLEFCQDVGFFDLDKVDEFIAFLRYLPAFSANDNEPPTGDPWYCA